MRIDLSEFFPNAAGDSSAAKSMETAEQESVGAFSVQMEKAWNPQKKVGGDETEKTAPKQTSGSHDNKSQEPSSSELIIPAKSTETEVTPDTDASKSVSPTFQVVNHEDANGIAGAEVEAENPLISPASEKVFPSSAKVADGVQTQTPGSAQSRTALEMNLPMSGEALTDAGKETAENRQGSEDVSGKMRTAAPVTDSNVSGKVDHIPSKIESSQTGLYRQSEFKVFESSTPLVRADRTSQSETSTTAADLIVDRSAKALSNNSDADILGKLEGVKHEASRQLNPSDQPLQAAVSNKPSAFWKNSQVALENNQQEATVLKTIPPQSSSGVLPQAEMSSITPNNGLAGDFKSTKDFNGQMDNSGIPVSKKAEAAGSIALDTANADDSTKGQDSRRGNGDMYASFQGRLDGSAQNTGRSLAHSVDRHHENAAQLPSGSLRVPGTGGSHTPGTGPLQTTQPKEFVFQLAQQIQVQLRNGRGMIRIQLKPESLGRLEIRAETTSAGVVARIAAESANVKTYLENNLHSLQQTLQGQGLRADRIHITIQSEFDSQSSSGLSAQFGQTGSGHNGEVPSGSANQSQSADPNNLEEIAMDPLTWMELNPDISFHTIA